MNNKTFSEVVGHFLVFDFDFNDIPTQHPKYSYQITIAL